MDIFCFSFADRVLKWFAVLLSKSLYNIINELGVYGKGGINKFDDLFSVIRKSIYLGWRNKKQNRLWKERKYIWNIS